MNKKEFNYLVQSALEDLPKEFKERLENVDVVVEEGSGPRVKRDSELGPKKGLILGLYHGVPQDRRTHYYQGVLPDKITLYKANIEKVSGGEAEKIKETIKHTIIHEIAHHFGISDKRLRDLGVY